MKRRTKIICTLGPASSSAGIISKMAQAGMDVARLNFSHGDHKQHQKVINAIRTVNKRRKRPIQILQDLEGYRIRIGNLKSPIELKKGKFVFMSGRSKKAKDVIPLDCDFDIKALKAGMHVFISDGIIDLKIVERRKHCVKLQVIQGGVISSKKGVNIPGLKLKANIFTAKDELDIVFGIANKMDYVAQSFVRNKKDIKQIMELVKPHLPECKVIAKIENKEGVDNIDGIIDECDGIMVARGDLGVSLPIYQVPILQKRIINRTNRKKKLDVTATQMLESMIDNMRPTRAEVSDVANAILDGSDYVMLSGETAVGRFPVETVRMMRQIIEFTEKAMD